MKTLYLGLFLAAALLISCQPTANNMPPTLATTFVINRTAMPDKSRNLDAVEVSSQPLPTPLPTMTSIPISTYTPSPLPQEEISTRESIEPTPSPSTTPTIISIEETNPTLTPSATTEPTATYWPTVTLQALSEAESAGLAPCQNRVISDDLLVAVSQQFPLPESYIPPDSLLLSDYFKSNVTLGQPLYVRRIVIEPLQVMISEMVAAGSQPSIISAYRSYQEQALAWQWWSSQYPGRVAIMSARPGYSEHQLGTTIDFGSPELNYLFHVDFANTAEGIWLANNAHRFGFTLSYPANSYDITGLKYEPWHYRYVGQEMAEYLFTSGQILTSWQIVNRPPPCIP